MEGGHSSFVVWAWVGLITLRTWAHARIIRLTQLPSLKGLAFRAGITNEFAKHKFLGDTHLRTRLGNLSHPSLRKHSLPQGTLSIFVSNNQSPANLISLCSALGSSELNLKLKYSYYVTL